MSTLKAFHCYNSGIQISGENKWIHFNFFKYFSPSCVSMRLSRHGKSTILLNYCEQYAFRFVNEYLFEGLLYERGQLCLLKSL